MSNNPNLYKLPPNTNVPILTTNTAQPQPPSGTGFKNIPVVHTNNTIMAPKPTNQYISPNPPNMSHIGMTSSPQTINYTTSTGNNIQINSSPTITTTSNLPGVSSNPGQLIRTATQPSSPPLNINHPSILANPGGAPVGAPVSSPMINNPTNSTSNPSTPGSIESSIDTVFRKNNLVGNSFSPIQNISSPNGILTPSTPPTVNITSTTNYSNNNNTGNQYLGIGGQSITPNNMTTTTTTTTTSSNISKSKKFEKERKEREQRDREIQEREQRDKDILSGRVQTDRDQTEVLGKRKLTELLSQISQNEKMDEDVEDILTIIADDFVESVASFACSLAKHRNSSTLEVKDLQCHLERSWNIKIPGFGNPDHFRPYKKPHYPDSHKLRIQTMKKAIAINQSLTRKHLRLQEQQQQMNRE